MSDLSNIYRPSSYGGLNFIPETAAFIAPGSLVTWANMPAALTELGGTTIWRIKSDLSYATQVRIVLRVMSAGYATAKMRAQFSTDETNWYYLDGVAGPSVDISAVGTITSPWVNITANTRQDVFIRLVGIDGDGIVDPQFGIGQLQFK